MFSLSKNKKETEVFLRPIKTSENEHEVDRKSNWTYQNSCFSWNSVLLFVVNRALKSTFIDFHFRRENESHFYYFYHHKVKQQWVTVTMYNFGDWNWIQKSKLRTGFIVKGLKRFTMCLFHTSCFYLILKFFLYFES